MTLTIGDTNFPLPSSHTAPFTGTPDQILQTFKDMIFVQEEGCSLCTARFHDNPDRSFWVIAAHHNSFPALGQISFVASVKTYIFDGPGDPKLGFQWRLYIFERIEPLSTADILR